MKGNVYPLPGLARKTNQPRENAPAEGPNDVHLACLQCHTTTLPGFVGGCESGSKFGSVSFMLRLCMCVFVCVVSVHCGKWRAHTPREGNKFNKCCLFILIKSSCNSSTDIDKITLQRAFQQEAAGNGAGKRLLISGELWRRACVDLGIFRRLFVAYPCKGQRVKRHFKYRFLNSVCHVLRFEESLFSKLFSRNQPKTRYNTLQTKLTFKLENFRDNFSTSRMEFSIVGKVTFLKIHL